MGVNKLDDPHFSRRNLCSSQTVSQISSSFCPATWSNRNGTRFDANSRHLSDYLATTLKCSTRRREGLDGDMPGEVADAETPMPPASFQNYTWQPHCNGLFKLPIAASSGFHRAYPKSAVEK
jgi:hypothetical protein